VVAIGQIVPHVNRVAKVEYFSRKHKINLGIVPLRVRVDLKTLTLRVAYGVILDTFFEPHKKVKLETYEKQILEGGGCHRHCCRCGRRIGVDCHEYQSKKCAQRRGDDFE
jgi:DNA-directed RNA polymerase subunit N (RpoN/RPB10)